MAYKVASNKLQRAIKGYESRLQPSFGWINSYIVTTNGKNQRVFRQSHGNARFIMFFDFALQRSTSRFTLITFLYLKLVFPIHDSTRFPSIFWNPLQDFLSLEKQKFYIEYTTVLKIDIWQNFGSTCQLKVQITKIMFLFSCFSIWEENKVSAKKFLLASKKWKYLNQ